MKIALAISLTALLASASAAGQGLGGVPQDSAETNRTSPDIEEAARPNAAVVRLYAAGKYSEALTPAQRVLELREKELGRAHTQVAAALVKLAAGEAKLGKTEVAKEGYKRAV